MQKEMGHVAHYIPITQSKGRSVYSLSIASNQCKQPIGYSGSKNYRKMFSLLVFSILMTYRDQKNCVMDRSSLYLILCRHSLYTTEEKCSEKITKFILLQKIIISVQPLQACYDFVWVAKIIHSHRGHGCMAYYFFKNKAFEWGSKEECFCQCRPDWHSYTKITDP